MIQIGAEVPIPILDEYYQVEDALYQENCTWKDKASVDQESKT
jgi:hypothetical protein